MLTRLEVDGFKNLIDFSIDFGPYTCIAGPNGVGKSNIFDAIRFLSLLADRPLEEAALLVRGGDLEVGDVRDLFWTNGEDQAPQFEIAAEMLIEPDVFDDFGRPTEANSSYLRYEIKIGFEKPANRVPIGRLTLLSEKLDYITEGKASKKLKFPHNPTEFRKSVVINKRRTQSGYISVQESPDGFTEILVHQDGGSRGPAQTSPASSAPSTIVGTSNTSVTPTILAARREMQQWRFLALEPSAMRSPDRFRTPPSITINGGHVPATLARLVQQTENSGGDAEDVYSDVAMRVAQLVPISDMEVEIDDARQLLTLKVREENGIKLPAASLSDGTLRFMTLAVLASDSSIRGLICIEEPENGIHPAKVRQMVELLQSLAVNPMHKPDDENPFRQIIIATHSPAFVQLQNPNDVLFAIEALVSNNDQKGIRTLRCRPLANTWRSKQESGPSVGHATIQAYLTTPPGAQIKMFDDYFEPVM